MSKRSVYILGAGFSEAVKIPTSGGFFSTEMFDYLRTKQHENANLCERIDKIQNYVNFRFEKEYFENNVEEILNHIATAKYLFMESISDRNKPYSADDIFEEILWYVTCIIREKTKDAVDSIPKEYRLFLKSVFENQSEIVTFNYDLIVETVLQSLGIEYHYGLDEQKNRKKSQLVLKLHGSLNWMHCNQCGPVHVEKSILYGISEKCPRCNSEKTASILIPPVIYKDSYYNDQLFGPLVRESWSLAREILSDAEEFIFVGFSMAEDAYAKELFKLSLSMNTNNPKCLVINRTCNDTLKERYESIFGKDIIDFQEETFENYVENSLI